MSDFQQATSESACSFHKEGELSARLSSSSSVLARATTATIRSKYAGHTTSKALFLEIVRRFAASASAAVSVRLKKRHGNSAGISDRRHERKCGRILNLRSLSLPWQSVGRDPPSAWLQIEHRLPSAFGTAFGY